MPDETPDSYRYESFPRETQFSMRPVNRETISEDTFLNEWAALNGGTRAQAEGWLRSLFALFVKYARQTKPVEFLLRTVRMLPIGGGVYTVPTPDAVEVRAHAGMAIILHRDVDKAVQHELPTEFTGPAGSRKPHITDVLGRPGNIPNRYSTTVGMIVYCQEARDGGVSAPEPRAWLLNADGSGTPIPVPVIESSPNKLVLGPAPSGTTGIKRLKIKAGYSDAFDIFDKDLTPM